VESGQGWAVAGLSKLGVERGREGGRGWAKNAAGGQGMEGGGVQWGREVDGAPLWLNRRHGGVVCKRRQVRRERAKGSRGSRRVDGAGLGCSRR
jgi:hypothetical protein